LSKDKKHPEYTINKKAERMELAEHIKTLSFNKYPGGKALIMVSGDLHMLAYSHGGAAANPLGEFPVF